MKSRSLIVAFVALKSDKMRELHFDEFWRLPSWDAKKAHVRSVTTTRAAVRRRKTTDHQVTNKKNACHEYYFACEDGSMVKVCQQFLIYTLDITHRQLFTWLGADMRAARKEMMPRLSAEKSLVDNWIALLPKVPSHYCRANTSRFAHNFKLRLLNWHIICTNCN